MQIILAAYVELGDLDNKSASFPICTTIDGWLNPNLVLDRLSPPTHVRASCIHPVYLSPNERV